MEFIFLQRWSPYLVGAGIGLLECLAFWIRDRPLGCSTAFARSAGMIEGFFRGYNVREREYYKIFPPVVDWELMLVAGIVLGTFCSAILSGSFALEWTPASWVEAFGANPLLRWCVALVGGICMGFGARWAGGCTGGHGISGTLHLALSSWIATLAFFWAGVLTAHLLF